MTEVNIDQKIILKERVDALFLKFSDLVQSSIPGSENDGNEKEILDRLDQKLQQLRKLSDEVENSQVTGLATGCTTDRKTDLNMQMSTLLADLVSLKQELDDIFNSSESTDEEQH